MAYVAGFERKRKESRNILEMRFVKSGVGILIENQGEKWEKEICKSPAGTSVYMVVTFTTVELGRGSALGAKIARYVLATLNACCP